MPPCYTCIMEPPPPLFYKLNFDGSVRGSAAAVGFIIHDQACNIVQATVLNIGVSSVIIADPSHNIPQWSTTCGIIGYLQHYHWRKNLLVVKAINNLWETLWKNADIIADCITILRQYNSWQVRHVFCEANRATDSIIDVGHLIIFSFDITPCNNSSL